MGLLDTKDMIKGSGVIGGVTVSTVTVPRLQRHDIARDVGFSLKELGRGMKLTLGYFARPKTVVTSQYPENRETLKLTERYRAMLKLKYDDNGWHNCTGCGICERICPNNSIILTTRKGEVTGKKEIDRYIWRLDSCTFCNSCVVACPFDALEMGPEFENAVYDRRLLIFNLNRYAGPPASVLAKHETDQHPAMMSARNRFGGPIPLNGVAIPKVRPLAGINHSDSEGDAS